MKRVLIPILYISVLALAGLPASAWADTAPADAAAVPVDQAAPPLLQAAQGGPPGHCPPPGPGPTPIGCPPGGGGGGGGNPGPPPALSFSKTCQTSAETAPGPGGIDSCNIFLSQGTLQPGTSVTVTLVMPQGVITSCSGSHFGGSAQCTYSFPQGHSSGLIGIESFAVSPNAAPGTPVRQSANVCPSSGSCFSYPVVVSGAGAVVGSPSPPPPSPPFVTKSCVGPNSGGTVYAGQQDTCTVYAAAGNTFSAGNRITVNPGTVPGATGCSGVPGVTSASVGVAGSVGGTGGVATNPGSPSTCVYTVLGGATVRPGEPLGTEVITVPEAAIGGSAIQQGITWCSGGSEGICNAVPGQITATGPGGTVSIDPPISAQGQPISAAEGQTFSGTVASFSDADPSGTPSDYGATIDWGDGTSSDGIINGWSVSGSHTYAEEGAYGVTVTIRDPDTIYNSTRGFGSAAVADATLAAQGKTINTTNPFNGTLATFMDSDPNGAASDYTVTVNWGDGTTSPATATASQSGTSFEVSGTHAYIDLGPYTVTVRVCDAGGACADATSNILVFAYATGGNFVIGDGNSALGSAPTFWGAQWADANTVTGGAAPGDFKGFANNPSGPLNCGTAWSTSPGNSAHPPDTVPSYMAVVVASSISRKGSRISGDSPQVVILKTDSGYAPNPGHAGTGTVVAVLCP